MDYFAHGLWSYIVFHKTKRPWKAIFFGVLPDTLSWLIYFLFIIATGKTFIHPELLPLPWWVDILYKATHSLVLFAVILLILLLIFKHWTKIPLFVYAYPLHILIDIPTHSRAFLPTPFLWPLSDWKFPGISWGTPWFMVLNYAFIIAILTYIFWKRKKGYNKKG